MLGNNTNLHPNASGTPAKPQQRLKEQSRLEPTLLRAARCGRVSCACFLFLGLQPWDARRWITGSQAISTRGCGGVTFICTTTVARTRDENWRVLGVFLLSPNRQHAHTVGFLEDRKRKFQKTNFYPEASGEEKQNSTNVTQRCRDGNLCFLFLFFFLSGSLQMLRTLLMVKCVF